jgi:hypothetical protein
VSTDGSGIRDTAQAELNPPDDPGPAEEQPAALPDRPTDGAKKDKWVDYVVALGADRRAVTGNTEHWDDELGGHVATEALSREDLINLADALGG